MKTTYKRAILTGFVLTFLFQTCIYSQIQIDATATPADMVEFMMGPGVYYDNITYQGADIAKGIFTSGNSTNIGLDEGIFLTSGAGYIIPGPNMSSSSGVSNGLPGNPWLDAICTASTYDASVLGFDFVPLNDTIRCRYVFGSEEYNEYVNSSFNDVFGFFVSGPNPNGGNYGLENIALIPGTNEAVTINNVNNGWSTGGIPPNGPCTNCEYFIDNTGGLTIEYDGFTTVLTAWVLVIPGETYNFTFGTADAGDHIFDSGVLMEGNSFKSPGPAEFFAFNFLMEHNPDLAFDVIGEIEGHNVFLSVPDGTDLTDLVASWEEHGADVFIGEERQLSGQTANDFTNQQIYHLVGYESAEWNVFVDVVVDVPDLLFSEVKIGPNPAVGEILIENSYGFELTLYNTLGVVIYHSGNSQNKSMIGDLQAGIYYIKLKKEGKTEVRKIIVK
ncbi:MAG: T9SS type A sorting domain-containing protein [Bacteroidales bacterium]|nr:T9SS type A sorting domain-containing protein [Bacteroidales bacterium]MCF8402465.1 T9SS type A sorting domain-containing protein [Bacteroidales bacterium]